MVRESDLGVFSFGAAVTPRIPPLAIVRTQNIVLQSGLWEGHSSAPQNNIDSKNENHRQFKSTVLSRNHCQCVFHIWVCYKC